MDERGSVNFTIVPDSENSIPRIYCNFCAIRNSPFDITLTFCEMQPLDEKSVREAQSTHVVKAPVRTRIVLPIQMVQGLITALQENYKLYQDNYGPPKGPLH
jgi:hypothetical protein